MKPCKQRKLAKRKLREEQVDEEVPEAEAKTEAEEETVTLSSSSITFEKPVSFIEPAYPPELES